MLSCWTWSSDSSDCYSLALVSNEEPCPAHLFCPISSKSLFDLGSPFRQVQDLRSSSLKSLSRSIFVELGSASNPASMISTWTNLGGLCSHLQLRNFDIKMGNLGRSLSSLSSQGIQFLFDRQLDRLPRVLSLRVLLVDRCCNLSTSSKSSLFSLSTDYDISFTSFHQHNVLTSIRS